ncbi:hypothetical protein GCM10009000_048340 [Halobacterium noricense]|uniref:Uncharacterized protein n=1 Tax=Haladaptatus pallidirubidus TaxID=1008152 RepID=A0AAV3UEP8_9EURY
MSVANHDNTCRHRTASHTLPNRLPQLADARFGRPSHDFAQGFGGELLIPAPARATMFVKIHLALNYRMTRWRGFSEMVVREAESKSREG